MAGIKIKFFFRTKKKPSALEFGSELNEVSASKCNNFVNKKHRWTRRLCQKNSIKYLNYTHRLQILNLENLEIRRTRFV